MSFFKCFGFYVDGWVGGIVGRRKADGFFRCRRTLDDYRDIFDAEDLKHAPQVHEHEFNPFLLHDPEFQELHKYEAERGVVRMRMFSPPHCGVDQHQAGMIN